MKILFLTITTICMLAVIAHMILTARRKGELAVQISLIQAITLISAASYLLVHYCTGYRTALFFYGVFFAAIDWMLVFVLDFFNAFAKESRQRRFTRITVGVFFVLSVLDTLSLFINPFVEHCFGLVPSDGPYHLWETRNHMFYTVHLVLCLLLAAELVAIMIIKIVRSAKEFRKYYIALVGASAFILIANTMHIFLHWRMNYLVIFYMIYAIGLYYLCYYIVPFYLEHDMQLQMCQILESAVACFDAQQHCIYANEAAKKLFEIKDNDLTVIEQYVTIWLYVYPIITKDSISGEDVFEIDGVEHIYTEEYRCFRDTKGRVQGSYIKLDDRTDEIRKLNEQRYMANCDALTGLYNRNYFFEEVARILQKNPDRRFYMTVSDIKDFKLINDMFGTEFGDRMLKDVADEMKKIDYPDCIAGRISADRFSLFIAKEDFDIDLAIDNLRSIQNTEEGVTSHIVMHIGAYEITDPKENVQVMYDRAVLAMEKILGSTVQQMSIYDDELMESRLRRKQIMAEFNESLAKGHFVIFLQPQVDTKERVIGAEALVRWAHPDGMIPPYQFIPILEETGYIYRLDRYVWEEACRQLVKWSREGREDLYISVNISTRDFYYTDLYETLTELVEQYNIEPSRLRLEITETALLHNLDQHRKTLDLLSEYGFIIEMDDFGSGYSSLSLLKKIHMDVLKVDMEFLRRSEQPKRARMIVASIIHMAKDLGMEVITEGVEEPSHVEFLRDAGCDVFQGYYYSKPIPVDEFEQKFLGREA